MKYTLFYSFANILNRGIQVLSIIYIATIYSILDIAKFSLFFPTVQLLLPLMTLVLFNLILKFGTNSRLKSIYYLNISNTLVLYTGCIVLCLTVFINNDIYIYYILLFGITEAIFQNFLYYFRTQKQYYQYFSISISKSIFIILTIFICKQELMNTLLLSFVILNSIYILGLILCMKKLLVLKKLKEVIIVYRKHNTFLIPILINFILLWVINNIDRYLVAFILTEEKLALLSISLSLAQTAFVINIVYMYILSEVALRNYTRYLENTFIIQNTVKVSIVGIIFYVIIFTLVYFDQNYFHLINLIHYQESMLLFSISYISFFIYNYYYYYYNIFYIVGNIAIVTKISFLLILFNIIMTIPTLIYLGIQYALIITALTNYFFILLLHRNVKQYLETKNKLMMIIHLMILLIGLLSIGANFAIK